jgi:hypothetical protein
VISSLFTEASLHFPTFEAAQGSICFHNQMWQNRDFPDSLKNRLSSRFAPSSPNTPQQPKRTNNRNPQKPPHSLLISY